MDPTSAGRILIVGGGIGGLALARALQNAGFDVAVFERDATRQDVQRYGGGIVLWHNAMAALKVLGLEAPVRAAGVDVTRAPNRTWRGRAIGELPIDDLDARWDLRAVSIQRARLYEVLAEAVAPGTVLMASECESVSDDPDEDRITLRVDGRSEHGALVVCADGRRSRFRTALGLATADYPPYAGYTHWSAIAPSSIEPGAFPIHYGRGAQFYYFHLGEGEVYWAGALWTDACGTDPPGGAKDAVRTHFGSWHEPIVRLIEATPESAIHRRDISGGIPLATWHKGRTMLLGDAAHPLTLTLGQGAAMAIEDAVVFARCLVEARDHTQAQLAFEARRMHRTARIMAAQRAYERDGATSSPIACMIRDFFIARVFAHGALVRRTRYYREMTRRALTD